MRHRKYYSSEERKNWPSQSRERRSLYERRYLASEKGQLQLRKRKYKVYGLTIEDWDALFATQNFCCAACGSPSSGTKLDWHTDHDHVTKKVRGILCHHCNHTAGQAKENILRLYQVAAYLEKHQ